MNPIWKAIIKTCHHSEFELVALMTLPMFQDDILSDEDEPSLGSKQGAQARGMHAEKTTSHFSNLKSTSI